LTGPHFVLKGHRDAIAAVAVNTDLGVAVAASPRGGCTTHCLLRGVFLRASPELKGELLAISPEGVLIAWERKRHKLRVGALTSGEVVAEARLEHALPPLSAMTTTADGKFCVVGTEAGGGASATPGGPKSPARTLPAGVAVFTLPDLRLVHVWELHGLSGVGVASMALTGDNTNLVVSGTDGGFTVIADPKLSMRLVQQMFSMGWESMA
jgi:hypothetical protein